MVEPYELSTVTLGSRWRCVTPGPTWSRRRRLVFVSHLARSLATAPVGGDPAFFAPGICDRKRWREDVRQRVRAQRPRHAPHDARRAASLRRARWGTIVN